MNKEELILERLDRIEAQLTPMAESFRAANELKEDATPLANHAFQLMIKELEDVETSCQIEDLLEFLKRLLRSVRTITYALDQVENLVDFITTLEPLLKRSVPQLIHYLDDLEQRGVFRILNATLGVRAKIAAAYSPEDIEQIGDGLVSLLGLAKKMTQPQVLAFLEALADIPCEVEFSKAKEVGPFGFLWALGQKDVKEGLGVLVELTKSMGKLRECGLKPEQ